MRIFLDETDFNLRDLETDLVCNDELNEMKSSVEYVCVVVCACMFVTMVIIGTRSV